MGNLTFTEKAWDDYNYWLTQDRKTLRRINQLLADIQRNGYTSIGKPEPLKGNLSGLWSRRIDEINRLVYVIENASVKIISCRTHYGE